MNEILDLTNNRRAAMIFDLCGHEDDFGEVREVMRIMGIVPPSAEGIEFEHTRSHIREVLVEDQIDAISAYCRLAAEITSCLTLEEPENADPESTLEAIEIDTATYTTVVATVLGMIAMDQLEKQALVV